MNTRQFPVRVVGSKTSGPWKPFPNTAPPLEDPAKKQTPGGRLIRPFAAALVLALLSLSALSCPGPIGFLADAAPAPNPPPEEPPASGPDPVLSIEVPGLRPVAGAGPQTYISSTAYTGDIRWAPALPPANRFESFKDYTATIELAMKGGRPLPPAELSVTVEGALSAVYDAAAGTITAAFPRTHRSVDSVAQLHDAISTLSSLSPPAGGDNKNIIELTPAFYTDANGTNSFLAIGVGVTTTTIPFTIRGQGKFSPQALTIGILLANNNITLEDVRVEITDSAKGVLRKWTSTLSYRVAVLIGRYTAISSPFEGGLGSQNVTVTNCHISFKDDDSMIAGLLVSDGTSRNIVSIDNNVIAVESVNASYAAQALLLYRYDPLISITGNGLESKNVPATSGGNPTTYPAAAIFMHLFPDINSSYTPLISGNTINGNPTYDFYIDILNRGGRIVIPVLAENKFATRDSTWMTAASTDTGETRSFYKKLLGALMDQSRGGAGYGYLALDMDAPNDYVYECYYRQNNRLWAIDFWGYHIVSGAYTSGPANEVRARLLLNDNGLVYEKNAQFHWTRDIAGNAGNNGLNIPLLP
jgi:hypothetical protein